MKCPNCGDMQKQRSLAVADERSDQPHGYRCGMCGRLYQVPAVAPTTPVVPSRQADDPPDAPGIL